MKVINELSNGAICGPDGWSVKLIKGMKHVISKFLYRIYCNSKKSGRYPSNQKNGFVAGVYKSGPKDIAANYRPIVLRNYVSKLLERIVRKDITKYIDNNNL